MSKTVILAYSGGLDTSVCVKWLADRGWRVVAFMANVGQGDPSSAAIRRAKAAGAAQVTVRDVRREFLTEYCWPALKADAVYEGQYLLATALSRPLIAKHLVDVAHRAGARAIAHGCTGKGNDQVRFEVTSRILDPSLEILAPVREWEFRSREQEIEYALKHRIPIDVSKRSPYSIDQNLWGTSIESGVLENPWTEPPADTFRSIRAPQRAAAKAATVVVGFTRGVPTHLNGRRLGEIALVERLNALGAAHAVGRSDVIESRVVGIKSREVYEAPAGTILLTAHQELERLVCDRELLKFKQEVAITYAHLIYAGLWFTPLKKALDAFVNATQQRATGEVRLKLYKGSCQVVGRRSRYGLYRERLATYSAQDDFDQRTARDFIKLYGLAYEGSG
ncbi:MAG: argininosuccinate synthase [Candidatus Omnitrophica bacterium CG11_big_fil_rev_8_21_14_0_20_63_9]|nr:MAG: argininosuccinate synthase [Candidatus Omnitrophica bacterium CG11_big_fil_rev_8_21_14_0_20_63_9]